MNQNWDNYGDSLIGWEALFVAAEDYRTEGDSLRTEGPASSEALVAKELQLYLDKLPTEIADNIANAAALLSSDLHSPLHASAAATAFQFNPWDWNSASAFLNPHSHYLGYSPSQCPIQVDNDMRASAPARPSCVGSVFDQIASSPDVNFLFAAQNPIFCVPQQQSVQDSSRTIMKQGAIRTHNNGPLVAPIRSQGAAAELQGCKIEQDLQAGAPVRFTPSLLMNIQMPKAQARTQLKRSRASSEDEPSSKRTPLSWSYASPNAILSASASGVIQPGVSENLIGRYASSPVTLEPEFSSTTSVGSPRCTQEVKAPLNIKPVDCKRKLYRQQAEQKRRSQLRDAFEEIRNLIPASDGTSTSRLLSKEKLLDKAADYVLVLRELEKEKCQRIQRLETAINEMVCGRMVVHCY
ncbi:hypothetical protein BJ741DRAFT_603395 [Chytriomyces cf. hyalinus JEL632]|nr:hypothetical protein BJ741DRAFT_603395 [Chytriomyces cf. hyalinus JEL632]